MERFYFTAEGLKKYQKRIEDLEAKLRALQSQTAEIAEVGGNQYHDNASYEQLVIQIRGIDAQLSEGHKILNNIWVVDKPNNAQRVCIGCLAQIEQNGEKKEIQIMGYGESDPKNGKISYNAPLAKSIIGAEIGEVREITIGGRLVNLEIFNILIPK